jgi:formylmethanofuran dehydrogenase subunit E
LGASCPYRNVEVHYCDKCGEELEDIYDVDGEELCEECLKEAFRKVL